MKKLIRKLNISKKEWRFVFLLILVIIIITTLPYLYAYFNAPQNKIYNGMHMLTHGDIYVYFSYLEQTAQGKYLFKNLFTSETTMPVFNIFWLAIGLLGKILNLNHIITFQLARILLIPICIISLYFLISYFFECQQIRKITLTILIFSSGAGALASFFLPAYLSNKTLFYWPMDLWTPEHNTFLTLYHSPHLIASLILIVLIFLFFLKAIDENRNKYSIIAGLCGMLLVQFHPFHLPTIVLVPAFYILVKCVIKGIECAVRLILQEAMEESPRLRTKIFSLTLPLTPSKGGGTRSPSTWGGLGWGLFGAVSKCDVHKHIGRLALIAHDLKHLFIFYTLTAPAVLYYALLTNFDWATNLKALQNHCYTPRFFVVLISYGGLIIFGSIGILLSLKYFYTLNYKTSKIPVIARSDQRERRSNPDVFATTTGLLHRSRNDFRNSRFYNKKRLTINIQHLISENNLLFLAVWAITQFALIFMPFRFQRRLTEGLQIPLVFLTIIAFFYIREKFKNSPLGEIFLNKFSLVTIFILGFTVSNFFILKIDMEYFAEKNELFYFNKQQIQSYEFLKSEMLDNDVILSGIVNGNAIPGVAGKKVYFGHIVETLYCDSKSAYMNWFFKDNTNDEKKINFLQQNNIKYIYYSKHEKEMGNFQPTEKDYLEQIYSNEFATIYKVKDTRNKIQ